MPHHVSIKDELRAATTQAEIDEIMARAATYKTAMPKTQRQWDRLADRRRKEVSA